MPSSRHPQWSPPEPEPQDPAARMVQAEKESSHSPCQAPAIRRPRRLTAEIIISAAADCFYANGYAATTLATVADRLNVTDKAIYHYFKSKDRLYLETINACMDWVTAVIEFIDAKDDNGLDKVKEFARIIIRNSGKRRPYLRTLPEHLEDTELGRRFRTLERAHENALIGWIKDGIEDSSIRPADPKLLWKWNQGALIWLDAWARDLGTYGSDVLENAVSTMLDRSLGTNFDPHGTQ